jgi:hypothetical protein
MESIAALNIQTKIIKSPSLIFQIHFLQQKSQIKVILKALLGLYIYMYPSKFADRLNVVYVLRITNHFKQSLHCQPYVK